jgi:hypothetical protein
MDHSVSSPIAEEYNVIHVVLANSPVVTDDRQYRLPRNARWGASRL